jgi:cytochrome c peroxidase
MFKLYAIVMFWLTGGDPAALRPYPVLNPGDPAPQKLYQYTGKGAITYDGVDRIAEFRPWMQQVAARKQRVMEERAAYLAERYNWSAVRTDKSCLMSGGRKPVPMGPVTRLPQGASWESLAGMTAEEIRRQGLFPEGFRPLSHPLHSTGHMLFPQSWTRVHPEHQRFDVDHDIPEAFLPEFPPPLFLTTRPDLGDISQGREITFENHREFFDGVLTPEQMEGVRLLLTKFPTSWFNTTKHRVTEEPSRGVACFDCHVNGHTNGALGLDPGTRPQLARVRLDTPTIRGNHIMSLFSLKRSIRTLEHFAEIEEYFDGDISMQLQVGGRQLDKPSTNRMGDFMSIIGFPPAEKLDRLGRLIHAKATPAEIRGEALFFGKAQCGSCHPAPFYTDNRMHDLRVEEFYTGRAQGWVKTFSLRGIKDSPPYFHDGRLPTLEDTVEFFNLLLGTKLSPAEKEDLATFLRCL